MFEGEMFFSELKQKELRSDVWNSTVRQEQIFIYLFIRILNNFDFHFCEKLQSNYFDYFFLNNPVFDLSLT